MRKGWEIKTLGDACYKASSNVSQNQLEKDDGKYPIYGASGFIKNVSFYHRDKPYLSIVKDGSGVGRVNKMEAYSSIIGTLQYIIPKDNVDLDYLYYSLICVDFKKYVAGAAIPHIYFKDYQNEPFLWMPFPEQKRIVAILDEAFAAIDKAKANTERNLQNAKELFESNVQNIFANNNWNKKPIAEVCENLDGKRIPVTENKRKKGDVPYYGASGIVDYVEEYIFDEDLLLVSEDGANLLMRTYPIAFSINGKTWVNNHAHVLRFKNLASQRLVEYYLNSIRLDKYVSGMAQPKLNQKMLNSIPVPYPDNLSLHEKVVKQLNRLYEKTRKLETTYQVKLDDLDELKKSILQKAFNGELIEKEVLI